MAAAEAGVVLLAVAWAGRTSVAIKLPLKCSAVLLVAGVVIQWVVELLRWVALLRWAVVLVVLLRWAEIRWAAAVLLRWAADLVVLHQWVALLAEWVAA